ncbi:helix-turn-helix transcriptional regulator [Rugamonas sp.]|uniref:helix-turn-helix domain-containing protein n=1 Tax=Rugamonas sp. TaxID=1926287 RepID=UPI0025E64E8B|nr:helix-turn-helix transcriptional regulator [Rugamonas sp.]
MLYDPRYESLRRLLIEARRHACLTQVELAALLGKGQSFVSKVESGERYLDVLQFVIWCERCKVEPSDIIRAV